MLRFISVRYSSTDASGFAELGVQLWLVERLRRLGIRTPTEAQRKSLPLLLSGRHVVLNAETGSGKTLCFLLPILQRIHDLIRHGQPVPAPYALILVPTPDLAAQVNRVYCELSGSDGSSSVLHSKLRLILKPSTHLITATPTSLTQYSIKRILRPVRTLVCDETDILLCGSERKVSWTVLDTVKGLHQEDVKRRKTSRAGDSTAPAQGSSDVVSSRQLVFTAATLPAGGPKTVTSLLQQWTPKSTSFVSTGQAHQVIPLAKMSFIGISLPPELKEDQLMEAELKEDQLMEAELKEGQLMEMTDDRTEGDIDELFEAKVSQLLSDLDSMACNPRTAMSYTASLPCVLIFCNTVEDASRLFNRLTATPHSWWSGRLGQLHKGVSHEERVEVMALVHSEQVKVLICTDVASRGLDFNSSHVIQFDFPGNAADFLHRAGRTARAGRSGEVLCYITSRDEDIAKEIKKVINGTDASFAELFSRNKMLRRKIKARKRAQQNCTTVS